MGSDSSDAISSLDKDDDILDPKSIAKRAVGVTNARSPTCFISSARLLGCSDEENYLNSNDRVSKKRKKKEAFEDQALAEQLQHIEADAAAKKAMKRTKRQLEEMREMLNSSDGKAVLAVQEIVALVQSAKDKYINGNPALQQLCVETVAMDDMVFMAKNMLEKQEIFTQGRVSGHIGKSHDW